MWPRTLADVFAALHRAGYRVEVLVEPEPMRGATRARRAAAVVWRARKEGV